MSSTQIAHLDKDAKAYILIEKLSPEFIRNPEARDIRTE